MSDAAFPTAKFPGMTTAQLRLMSQSAFARHDFAKMDLIAAEITRREAVAAGDVSQMTAGERLRYVKANPGVSLA